MNILPVLPLPLDAPVLPVAEKIVPVIADDAMERTVLGNILVDCTRDRTNTAFEEASHLKPDAFNSTPGRFVYRVMERLFSRNVAIDLAMIRNELKDVSTERVNAYEAVGEAYLRDLMLAEGGNTPAHINVLAFNALRRDGDKVALGVQKALHNTARELPEIAHEIETVIMDYVERVHSLTGQKGVNLATAAGRYLASVRSDLASDVNMLGISSGYKALDRYIGGFRRKLLYLVAGRASTGKTALMLNLALESLKSGHRVLFITLEQPLEEIMDRLMAIESGLNGMDIVGRNLSLSDVDRLAETTQRFETWAQTNAFIILPLDEPTMGEIFEALKSYQMAPGFDIVFVDYAGPTMIRNDNLRRDTREHMSHMAKGFKKFAKKFSVPFVVGAQLNRAADDAERPILKHLAESSGLENAADGVMLLYRDDRIKPVNGVIPIEVIVAKHRNGLVGTAFLGFFKACTKFLPSSGRPNAGGHHE